VAQALEERVSRLEGAFEQMNERLGSIEGNIGGLRGEMGGLRQEMADLRKELHTNFRWTMGTIIAMWVTVICAIMFA
jgi:predicted nuclease with TOPRIM domain